VEKYFLGNSSEDEWFIMMTQQEGSMLANLNSSCMLRAFLQKYLGPPQTRHLVVDNYLLSTAKCYRQLKNAVCEISCRQLSAKYLVVDNKAVSLFGKGNCLIVDNYVFDRFSRVRE